MESLPSELATAIFETLGFHHRPAAQAVSKSWHGLDALVECRARHRATVASFPPPPPDNEFGRGGEFVGLRPHGPLGIRPRTSSKATGAWALS